MDQCVVLCVYNVPWFGRLTLSFNGVMPENKLYNWNFCSGPVGECGGDACHWCSVVWAIGG